MNLETQIELRQKLHELLRDNAESMELYISGIEFSQEPRGLMVRLYLDGKNGVGIAQCARFSRESSPLLDAEDFFKESYILEVSSPGFDRLIERQQDFQRFQGFNIRVKRINRKNKIKGVLISSDSDGFVIETSYEQKTIPYEEAYSVRLSPTEEEIERLKDLQPQGENK